MAKYIGTYTNSGAVQTALDNLELSRPFVAYTADNNEVIYGPANNRAEAGDIVVYATGDTLLHYIKQADYSASTYPVADYVPVGVVAYEQDDDIYSGATGPITFMALNWLSSVAPDTGTNTHSSASWLVWGYNGFDVPELTNYSTSATAINDMNGKANTEAVLVYATGQTNWKTDSAITTNNAAGYYPLFECAWRYHTSGTVQGDWYIPSCGELYKATKTQDKIDAITAAYAFFGITGGNAILGKTRFGTSTETNNSNAWSLKDGSYPNCFFTSQSKATAADFSTRAFCSKLMTRI